MIFVSNQLIDETCLSIGKLVVGDGVMNSEYCYVANSIVCSLT